MPVGALWNLEPALEKVADECEVDGDRPWYIEIT
jgi:hypothetical protein